MPSGWPKGKPRGSQSAAQKAKSGIGIRKAKNTPEVFELTQQYGCPLIEKLRQKYNDLNQRCGNLSCEYYGGRGIQNLFSSLEHFLNHVIKELHITTIEQIDGLEIDRIDNDSHYMPENIRFITRSVNQRNKRISL